ncbi:FAD-binding protein [Pseudonocardiaceae bacterium YIM PH 21723]|nr:FAD-binding protein [Pseudonocardiaceae bacterium YIM PH 21723]
MSGRVDVLVVGAGPVGLMCAYLGQLLGLSVVIVDRSAEPLQAGRADALNARSLQLLEIVDLFAELYPHGRTCDTSSVWADGGFVSRQSAWWESLEGCFHRHFLMIGQSFVERVLDDRVTVRRNTTVDGVAITERGCVSTLSTGEVVESRFVIGADGSRSFVRDAFGIPFEITRPELTWAVLDAVIETDFPKVPEIIVFQADTSDVAWIPREGYIDRFYVRMDREEFTLDEVLTRVNRAVRPHAVTIREVDWFSRFSVKESVAERFSLQDKVFLVGDACHIHSVNGGQGLNTGLADAFNLMWKLAWPDLLSTYEAERKPVALSVVETSGALVRSTKYSETGTHAEDYVRIVERRAGNITGMGIRYGEEGLVGTRLHDFAVGETRMYSLLDYRYCTLLVGTDEDPGLDLPPFVQFIRVGASPYPGLLVLVRPDSYIAAVATAGDPSPIIDWFADPVLFTG